MQTVSATDAKQRLAALLDTAQREPVMIRRHERDVAVLLSVGEFERLREVYVRELEELCKRVSTQAKARGMSETVLQDLLRDE